MGDDEGVEVGAGGFSGGGFRIEDVAVVVGFEDVAAAGEGGVGDGVVDEEDIVVGGGVFFVEAESAAFEVGEEGFEVEEGGDGVGEVFLAVAAADDEEVGVLGLGDALDFEGGSVELGDGDGGADDEAGGVDFGAEGGGELLLFEDAGVEAGGEEEGRGQRG